MAGFRFGLSFLDYLPQLAAGAAAVANRPVTNVEGYLYPLRTWRSASTSTIDKQVILDFTTATTVRHVFIGTANFSSVQIQAADNTAFTTNLIDHGSFAVNADRRVNRRKGWFSMGSPGARRYLRLLPSTIVGSATYYEIGVAACFDGITELVDSPGWPKQYTIRQAQTRTGFASGGEDVNTDGERYVEMTLAKDHWRKGSGVQAQLFDILDAGVAGPIAIFENLGDPTATWMTRRVNDVEFQERYVVFDTSLTFREAI